MGFHIFTPPKLQKIILSENRNDKLCKRPDVAANGTGQGAGILIVHGYTTYSHLRFEFIAGDKSSQGDKEREE